MSPSVPMLTRENHPYETTSQRKRRKRSSERVRTALMVHCEHRASLRGQPVVRRCDRLVAVATHAAQGW